MAYLDPGRPNEGEYPPLLGGHVRRVPEGAILAILDAQTATTERVLAAYSAAQAAWRPAAGEWNAIEITGHLADIERVHAFRALSVARGHTAELPGMNPTVYMDKAQFTQRPLTDVAAEFFAVRSATMAFLRSLDADAWPRTGNVLGSPISVRALAYIIAGHHFLHLADLERYPDLADRAAGATAVG
jgi:hypothetical protein